LQGKTLYTILLSIIAVLTLALAVMIIFVFTAFNGNDGVPSSKESQKPLVGRAVPKEEQAEFQLYGKEGNNEAVFNIKSTESHPNSFLMASISIIYDGGKKNKKLEERTALIEKNLSMLKQDAIKYFLSQSFDDLSAADAMEKARTALKASFNEIVSVDSEEMIIIDVVFDKWIKQ
jgi:flagellar basal body-associated protein FliL